MKIGAYASEMTRWFEIVYLESAVGCRRTQEDCWQIPWHQRPGQDRSACQHCWWMASSHLSSRGDLHQLSDCLAVTLSTKNTEYQIIYTVLFLSVLLTMLNSPPSCKFKLRCNNSFRLKSRVWVDKISNGSRCRGRPEVRGGVRYREGPAPQHEWSIWKRQF